MSCSEIEETIKGFVSLGLSEQKAKETLKNAVVTKILKSILLEVRGVQLGEGVGILLYHLATRIKPQIQDQLEIIIKNIVLHKLDTTLRVDKAIEYCLAHPHTFNQGEFEKFCGVGVKVSPAMIEAVVERELAAVKVELLKKRYHYNVGHVMQRVRNALPWADGKCIKNEVDVQVLDLLGPKTSADLAPSMKSKRTSTKPIPLRPDEPPEAVTILDVMRKMNFHKPGENFKTDGYVVTENTVALLKEHLKITNGRVRTRFPPEPNGVLHIGHAKAININFGYAAANNGTCYLRYDDTNPEKEEKKFFDAIRDMVEWLGYKPAKITHSSDNFQQLYEWAVQLIRIGLAYVCHQTAGEMKGFHPTPSPWRDRPVNESLRLFEDMKNGKIDEGAATLRMKITLEEGKLDPVAYRVRFSPHHRTGSTWCIYPTYDYTHCLCDSIEHITHSLCTKEFQSRRSSYYWLCNALNIYCPVQWEYGRLNVNYTVVSKRKIAQLIRENIVKDWDDPRLFTLTALRRRGFPPEAINNFCAQLGVTGAQSTVDPAMLEAFVRDYLNIHAPRVMVVLDPLKIRINNFPQKGAISVEVPFFPTKPELGSYKVAFNREIFIEKSDFMEDADKGYRRLTKTQSVGLRHAGCVLQVVDVVKNAANNEIVEVVCKCIQVDKVDTKPKAFIHWVSDPIAVDVRIYESLFKHKNPEDPLEVPGGFITDCNLDSLKTTQALADVSIRNAKVFDKFQFERLGFFSVDPDTSSEKIVFNKTVALKEDAGK